MVIDSHQHFWAPARGDYFWMSPDNPVLFRDYGPGDLEPLLRRAGVEKTILVQAAQTEAETDYMLEIAARAPFVAGVVGWLDFEDEAFAPKLKALMRRPKFVGLRPMLQDHPDDAYVLRPRVIENLRHVADLDLPFDILSFPRHLPHVLRALDQVPNLRAVVDHLSKPPIASGRLEGWADDISRVAQHPNISCKLSGTVTEADHANWTLPDLEPYVRHVFSAFGPDRVMWGSDWPVCLLAASYAEVLNAVRAILAPMLDAESAAKVFGGNAARFYKLPA
ncbi:MAG TPA: amidohydrolase family protein [Mesorhizobium sp.]|jgi:L-fuconolactonase|nr:amidohydrolase family protein [Mesorhizobium sp.]